MLVLVTIRVRLREKRRVNAHSTYLLNVAALVCPNEMTTKLLFKTDTYILKGIELALELAKALFKRFEQ